MILDKAKMAHDWAMKYGKVDSNYNRENTVQLAWDYADAMQAEADKRVVKLPDIFFNTKPNEEWQPDWSQAPEWAEYFAVNGDNTGAWMRSIDKPPYAGDPYDQWFCYGRLYRNEKAPSFNYQGKWQDSLRKRP